MAFELYVIDNPEQVQAVDSNALLSLLRDAQCANCDVVVGFYSSKFFRCVICVRDEEEMWVVCSECASGVTNPGE